MSWLAPEPFERELFQWLEHVANDASHRDLWRLALVLSPALRIEPLLLRNARQRFLPHTDASLENRFWFCSLVASRGARSVSLHPGLARLLWNHLNQRTQRAFRCRRFLEQHTRHWQELDRIEQTLRLAVVDPVRGRAETAGALRKAVREAFRLGQPANDPDEVKRQRRERGDLARWVKGAMPALAAALQDHHECGWLQQYAAMVSGDIGGAALKADPARGMPAWLHPAIPSDPVVKLRLTLYAGVLECTAEDSSGSHLLALDYPEPAPVMLRFLDLPEAHPRWERFWAGRRVAVPALAKQLELITLTGKRYRLGVVGESGDPAEQSGEQIAELVIEFAPADRQAAIDVQAALHRRHLAAALLEIGTQTEAETLGAADQGRTRLRLWSRACAASGSGAEYAAQPGGAWLRLDATPLPEGRHRLPSIDLDGWDGTADSEQAANLYQSVQAMLDDRWSADETGDSGPLTVSAEPRVTIPDNDPEGVTSTIVVTRDGVLRNLRVDIDIAHTYVGDLRVELRDPNGSGCVLHDREGGSHNDLRRSYDSETDPGLQALTGQAVRGDWTLRVSDFSAHDAGSLERWAMTLELDPAPAQSEERTTDQSADTLRNKVRQQLSDYRFALSYASADRERVLALQKILVGYGLQVAQDLDPRDIPTGKDFEKELDLALRRADCILLLWSNDAAGSEWVRAEAQRARELGKYFPVLLKNIEELPGSLQTVQSADLRDWDGSADSPSMIRLIEQIIEFAADRRDDGEAERLLEELQSPDTAPSRRLEIGDQLATLGDPRVGVGLNQEGLPDIDWVEVPAGEFLYGKEKTRRHLDALRIARYPITNAQYQAFVDDGGYGDKRWWEGLTDRPNNSLDSHWPQPNRPRTDVNWYEAVAFCRWLSAQRGEEIRLPTEGEWEKAARGTDGREYPWGNSYQAGFANINERSSKAGPTYLEQTTAVGLYLQGASPYGVLDLAGNVWEWCLSEYADPENTDTAGDAGRVLRGGSWSNDLDYARSALRDRNFPGFRSSNIGFRVLCSSPIFDA